MSDSLLPPNASDLELAVEKVLSRTEQIPVTIDTLWDPETAPENTLPWLAWALSVDEWSSAWSVETKRRVIANSVELHRKKGTRGAINLALSGINIETEITEWFEQIPKGSPGTFDVAAFVSDRGINEALYYEIKAAVDAAKNVRSHYALTVNLLNRSTIDLGAAVSTGVDYVIEPFVDLLLHSSAPVAAGMIAQSSTDFVIQPYPAEPFVMTVSFVIGGGVHAVTTNTVYPYEA